MVNSVGCSAHIRREVIVRLGVRARPDFGRNKISKRATPRNTPYEAQAEEDQAKIVGIAEVFGVDRGLIERIA